MNFVPARSTVAKLHVGFVAPLLLSLAYQINRGYVDKRVAMLLLALALGVLAYHTQNL